MEIEEELARLIRMRSLEGAATLALETYGAEVFGFLVNVVGKESDAEEIFSDVAVDLWRGLPDFALRCTVRTWLYVLARHATARFRRMPWNQRRRRAKSSYLDGVVAKIRTRTNPWLQTEIKDRWRALRETLDAEDKMLLVLRVDRGLPWQDVARIILDGEADDPTLAREANRLKKRFQILKADLRQRVAHVRLPDRD